MSVHTDAALAKLDQFAPFIQQLPKDVDAARLGDETDALRRAVSAFHMEAIRFRMYNVERLLNSCGDRIPPDALAAFDELRKALEAAGFHTRSHPVP
jgi:outer membrane murein-binding lipoprotein Lpp